MNSNHLLLVSLELTPPSPQWASVLVHCSAVDSTPICCWTLHQKVFFSPHPLSAKATATHQLHTTAKMRIAMCARLRHEIQECTTAPWSCFGITSACTATLGRKKAEPYKDQRCFRPAKVLQSSAMCGDSNIAILTVLVQAPKHA